MARPLPVRYVMYIACVAYREGSECILETLEQGSGSSDGGGTGPDLVLVSEHILWLPVRHTLFIRMRCLTGKRSWQYDAGVDPHETDRLGRWASGSLSDTRCIPMTHLTGRSVCIDTPPCEIPPVYTIRHGVSTSQGDGRGRLSLTTSGLRRRDEVVLRRWVHTALSVVRYATHTFRVGYAIQMQSVSYREGCV